MSTAFYEVREYFFVVGMCKKGSYVRSTAPLRKARPTNACVHIMLCHVGACGACDFSASTVPRALDNAVLMTGLSDSWLASKFGRRACASTAQRSVTLVKCNDQQDLCRYIALNQEGSHGRNERSRLASLRFASKTLVWLSAL